MAKVCSYAARLTCTTLFPNGRFGRADLHEEISIDVESRNRHAETGFLWVHNKMIRSQHLNDRQLRFDQHGIST
jgi:hypothetical protein